VHLALDFAGKLHIVLYLTCDRQSDSPGIVASFGIGTMIDYDEDSEAGFDSPLVDLGKVPLAAVRYDAGVDESMRHVLQQIDRPSKTQTSCSRDVGFD
jgi:hypothetical protein